MKKLIYNKHTNEIDLIEQKEIENSEKLEKNFAKKIAGIRERLERNKIFFEVFSLIFLGIMGAILSFVGVMINQRTADIYQKQLEIMENDSEPSFYSELCWIDAESMEYVYEIKNNGGIASDCLAYPVLKATFFINEKFVFFSFNDTFSAEKLESNKEGDMQCVIDFRRSKKFLKELEKELGEQCFAEADYVVLNYVNYRNENVFNYFSLGLEGMYVVDRDDVIKPDGIHITYNSDIDIKKIADSIKAKTEK